MTNFVLLDQFESQNSSEIKVYGKQTLLQGHNLNTKKDNIFYSPIPIDSSNSSELISLT